MIAFIENLARRAGDMLLSHFGEDEGLLKLRCSVKEAVTRYDKMADELICRQIRERYPGHSLLTEESGLLKGDPDWLWVVDSLDGTSGFASQNPLFSVCIAVMHKGELILEEYLGFKLTEKNSSIEFTGSALSQNFYSQLRFAIILAFILMAIVVFIIFRTFIPSLAVIFSAFADITMTLALVNILGIKMSSAGIVALLMLIGYSVDSDILLTTRVLKQRAESLNKRIYSAFKTGITMNLTSIVAIIIVLLIVKSLSPILTQIFTILLIGLVFDIPNTWLVNVGILKLYCKKKRIE